MKIHSFLAVMGLLVVSQFVLAEQPNQAATATTDNATATTVETEPSAAQQSEGTQIEQTPVANEATTEAVPSTQAQEESVAEQAGFSRGSVVRSVFTTGIQDREPVDQLSDTQGQTGNLFYFSELRDMSGQTAVHRWEHDGKVVSEVNFDVRGPRWRVWSSKSYSPGWEGEWKVSVVNGAGEVISEDTVTYTAPKMETTATEATEPSDSATATDESSEQPFEPPVNPEMIQ